MENEKISKEILIELIKDDLDIRIELMKLFCHKTEIENKDLILKIFSSHIIKDIETRIINFFKGFYSDLSNKRFEYVEGEIYKIKEDLDNINHKMVFYKIQDSILGEINNLNNEIEKLKESKDEK